MSMITAHRITSALLGGSMSSSQLETLLGTPEGLAGWKLCAATDSISNLLLTDGVARAGWMGSTKANDTMATLHAPAAVEMAANSTTMASIFNTAERADLWFLSKVTRAAIWSSDAALTALMGSPTGITRARACAKYAVRSKPGNNNMEVFAAPLGTPGAKFILIGWSTNVANNVEIYGRREGSKVGMLTNTISVNTTASHDNVMALLGPVKFKTSYVCYLGAVEV